jgi:hypothetical protein
VYVAYDENGFAMLFGREHLNSPSEEPGTFVTYNLKGERLASVTLSEIRLDMFNNSAENIIGAGGFGTYIIGDGMTFVAYTANGRKLYSFYSAYELTQIMFTGRNNRVLIVGHNGMEVYVR